MAFDREFFEKLQKNAGKTVDFKFTIDNDQPHNTPNITDMEMGWCERVLCDWVHNGDRYKQSWMDWTGKINKSSEYDYSKWPWIADLVLIDGVYIETKN